MDFIHQAMIQAIGKMDEFYRQKDMDFMHQPMIQVMGNMDEF